ncbi:MAG: hypothetical protein V4792_02135 [Pseudomonadota bacterium]
MSNQLAQTLAPALSPRLRQAGSLRAVVGQHLARAGRAVWLALEEVGQRRSDRELLALSRQWEHTNPTLARELRSYVRGGSSY